MAEKDVAEKQLLNLADVFANVANVLLFDGEPMIHPEELIDVLPRSTYRAKGKLREQERDVSKIWRKSKIRIAFLGLENQSDIDAAMPLRVISYDGAVYRSELNSKKKKKEYYPVITLVLYFGSQRHWRKPRRLKECFDIPEKLKRYVSDYRINVVEVAWLPDETIAKFDPPFRVVAEYFSQMRKKEDYHPSEDVIQHAKEVLDLLSLLTKDPRFEEASQEVKEGEERTMRSIMLDRMEEKFKKEYGPKLEEKYKDEYKAKGKAEGIAERTLRTIRNQLRRHADYRIIAEDNDTTVEEVVRIAKESGLAY